MRVLSRPAQPGIRPIRRVLMILVAMLARLQSVFRENNNSSYIFHLGSTGEASRDEISSHQTRRRARSPPRGRKKSVTSRPPPCPTSRGCCRVTAGWRRGPRWGWRPAASGKAARSSETLHSWIQGNRESLRRCPGNTANKSHSIDAKWVWWLRFSSPDVFPVDQSEEAEFDHVPGRAVLVSHQVQRHGNVRVTVIAAEVVLLGKEWGN